MNPMADADSVPHVDLKGDAGTVLGFEFTDLGDGLQELATEVLLHQEQLILILKKR